MSPKHLFNTSVKCAIDSIIDENKESESAVSLSSDLLLISRLVDFVTAHCEHFFDDVETAGEFERLKEEVLAQCRIPELHRTLKQYKWIPPGHVKAQNNTRSSFLRISLTRVQPLMVIKDPLESGHGPHGTQGLLCALTNLYIRVLNQSRAVNPSNMRDSTLLSQPYKLFSFVPDVVLRFLLTHSHIFNANRSPVASSRDSPKPVPCINLKGAILMADISGFSKFSGEMCARGLAGIDKLTEITNGFLGHFVQAVYDFKGDGKATRLQRPHFQISFLCLAFL